MTFFADVRTREEIMSCRIHHNNEAPILVKIGAIKKSVMDVRIIGRFWRLLRQPVVLNSLEFISTVSRKLAQLPDGITFKDPEFEPGKFVLIFNMGSL